MASDTAATDPCPEDCTITLAHAHYHDDDDDYVDYLDD